MEQPTFSYMNYDQTKFILTSNLDILFVDLLEKDQSKKEIDIDEKTWEFVLFSILLLVFLKTFLGSVKVKAVQYFFGTHNH